MRSDPERLLRESLQTIRSLRSELAQARAGLNAPVAVIGASVRVPGGVADREELFDLVARGTCAWTPGLPTATARLDDVDAFDASFFDVSAEEARHIDPQQKLLLQVVWRALEDAGITLQAVSGSAAAIFVGACADDYGRAVSREGLAAINAFNALGSARSILAGRLAYVLNTTGPAIAVDSSCSSSLVAVHLAVNSLRTRQCSLAIAAGVNVIIGLETTTAFQRLNVLSPTGTCRPFDAAADGHVRGEGAGALILKRLDDAQAGGDRILGVIVGTAINHSGRTNGLGAPNGSAQEAVIRAALRDAGVSPDQVHYIEGQATGSAFGDGIECHALGRVFAGHAAGVKVQIGSVKANVGHLEGAAGVVSVVKTLEMMRRGYVPGQAGYAVANPRITWDRLALQVCQGNPWCATGRRIAGVNAFGMSGVNAHVVLAYDPSDAEVGERPARAELLLLSAKSPDALTRLTSRYARYLQQRSHPPLHAIAVETALRRTHFPHRRAVVATSREEAAAALVARQAPPDPREPNIAYHFADVATGPRFRWRCLYERWAVFRAVFDQWRRCGVDVGWSLEPFADCGEADSLQIFGQCAVQHAVAMLLRSWGVSPHVVAASGSGVLVADLYSGSRTIADVVQEIAETGGRNGVLTSATGVIQEADPSALAARLRREGANLVVEFGRSELADRPRNGSSDGVVVPALAVGAEDRALLDLVARLYQSGLTPRFEELCPARVRFEDVLPGYPFFPDRAEPPDSVVAGDRRSDVWGAHPPAAPVGPERTAAPAEDRDVEHAAVARAVIAKLRDLIAGPLEISERTPLLSLALDSLAVLSLREWVRRQFDVSLSLEDVLRNTTVGELARRLTRQAAEDTSADASVALAPATTADATESANDALVYAALIDAGAHRRQRGTMVFLRLPSPGGRLSHGDQQAIIRRFAADTDVTYSTNTAHYWTKRTDYLCDLDELWTAHLDGRLVGWTGLRLLPAVGETVLYIDTMNVRHAGLPAVLDRYTVASVFIHEMLLAHFLRRRGSSAVAFRTQNPGVYMLAHSLLPDAVYPRIDGRGGNTEGAAAIARALTAHVSPGKVFDPDTFVVRDALGRYLYGESSRVLHAAEPAVAAYWSRNLALDRGDALVVVVRPSLREAVRLGLRYWMAIAGEALVRRRRRSRPRPLPKVTHAQDLHPSQLER